MLLQTPCADPCPSYSAPPDRSGRGWQQQRGTHPAQQQQHRGVHSPARLQASTLEASRSSSSLDTLAGRLEDLRQQQRGAFIPFLTAGDPDLATTREAILALDRAGADVVELGVPYSDPLADGPTIQASSTRALSRGTTLNQILELCTSLKGQLRAQLVLFTYYNPIIRRGVETFCREAKEAGATGVLVPDIPLEETGPIRDVASAAGLELVLLVTPTTPRERMAAIARASQGFVYLVSVAGVTGGRAKMESRVEGLIQTLKGLTDKPVAVGFGVSGPDQAAQLRAWGADGVIVGSALVKALGEAPSPEEGLQRMTELAQSIQAATAGSS